MLIEGLHANYRLSAYIRLLSEPKIPELETNVTSEIKSHEV